MDTPPQTPISVTGPLPRGGMRYLTAEARRKGKEAIAEAQKAQAQAKIAAAGVEMAKFEAQAARDASIGSAPSGAPVGREEAINTLSWAIRAAQAAGDYKAIAALVKELRDYQGYAATESEDTIDALARKIAEMRPPQRPAEG